MPRTTHRSIFATVLRLLLPAIVAMSLALPLVGGAAQSDRPRVILGQIDGTITPVMARYVERVIDRAERDDAAAVLFEMDTPGGLSTAMDDIIRDILESEVPVVVYVTPRGARAASAGVYISYAAHVSAMAPGTNIGSASPVSMSGEDIDETMDRKVTNDAVAQIKNLAQLRGRNAEWAEQAVRDAVNITADEALGLGVIDLLATDRASLLQQIDGRAVELATGPATLRTANATTDAVGMSWLEDFLQLLADPTIAYMLISLGLLGIYVEFSHPGITVPGIFGAIALLLGFFALGTIPVNWAGVLLIGLAFVLFAVDLYVPSLGTLTIGGLISFVLGSYLLIGDDTPPGYEIAKPVIWTMTACLLAFSLFLAAAVMKARLRPPATGKALLIGAAGTVRRPMTPRGMVHVQGELWDAVLEGGAAEPAVGDVVIVTGVNGLRLSVRPATAEDRHALSISGPDARMVIPVGGT
ncbi:MAG: nodulation protein NfeD [Thermomicrobiales bacterium]|nr:nodulation protein NfeD [Thermomicrobiales bacterium]